MWRTRIFTYPTTTETQLLEALPDDFYGHVTFDVDRNVQVCVIHHTTCIDPETVYDNLGIKLHDCLLLPLFLFEK